jgi:drug/metabolite transporter (DMT)-like permease
LSRRDLALLFLLAAIWGSSFMFIKVAVRDFSPSSLVLVRVALATLTLGLVMPFRMRVGAVVPTLRARALPIVVLALLNSALPFWLLFWAERKLDSGLAAILQASAPLFSALLAYLLVGSERVTGARLGGFVLGFGGVALLVGAVPHGSVVAAIGVLGTAFCYAAGGHYAARRFGDVPPLVIAFGTMLACTLLTLPFGLAQLPDHMPGWKEWASAFALGVGGSAIAYLLFYGLLPRVGPTRTILVTYLVPPMAVFYGVTVLGEPLTASALGGLALILAGVALGSGPARLRRKDRAVISAESAPNV